MVAIKVIFRVLLSALFLVSAVAKLLAIDDFELYIFSYGFLSLPLTYIAARLCIAVELFVGLFVAIGWWRRWVNLAALLLLIIFSVFLCYAALIGRTDSCQCMGRLADLPPALSLLKNAILILLVLFYIRISPTSSARHVIPTVVLAVAIIVAPFVISVPDNWMFGSEEMLYDKELLQETVEEKGLAEGHKLVAFVTPGCPYCQMSREKITYIAQRHNLDTASIVYLEPSDLGSQRFMDLTYGSRPLIILLDDGTPSATYHYRNISERDISAFLPQR